MVDFYGRHSLHVYYSHIVANCGQSWWCSLEISTWNDRDAIQEATEELQARFERDCAYLRDAGSA